tara:strand:- start:482 stop:793 length:312 start_codon:yes stop_codon:yes gene_type:complete
MNDSEKYFKDRKNFLKQSPEEKSKRLGFAGLCYKSFTGNYLKENVDHAKVIVKAQREYFTKNPKRFFCPPTEYKSVLGEGECNAMGYEIIKNQLMTDNELSRY